MKSYSVLIVGCGDIGIRCGKLLHGAGCQVAGIRRNIAALPQIIEGHAADYSEPGSLDFIAELQPDFVLATFNPSDRSLEGYQRGFLQGAQNLVRGLGGHRPKAIISVSSTRVYAEAAGGWVDENGTLAGAEDPRAVAIIAGEQALLASPHAASVVRFAGIYGYSGGRLLSRLQRGELCDPQPGRYSNRIHRDDCAGFLCHLLDTAAAGGELATVYNGVDNEPVLQFSVESWLATQLGVESGAALAEQPSGVPGGKRCRNQRLRDSGYVLRYPDYRSGYQAVLSGEN